MATNIDGFNCKCSNCKKFYKNVTLHSEVSTALCLPPEHIDKSFTKASPPNQRDFQQKGNSKHWIQIGDRVTAQDKFKGKVKFIGPLDTELLTPELYVGIQLDEPIGMHSGIVNGKCYFNTPLGCGLMVKYHEVKRVKPADRRPPVYGNSMYPSYKPRKCSDSLQDRTGNNKPWTSSRNASNKTPARRSTRQYTLDSKRQTSKSKLPDPLPPKLRQEASKWKQNTSIKQPDVLKTTLTKLYLAKEKGKQEIQELERLAKEEEEKERQKQAKHQKFTTRTSNTNKESAWRLSETV